MNPKLILCLALVLSGGLVSAFADIQHIHPRVTG